MKRLVILVTLMLASLLASCAAFSLLMLTASSAYAEPAPTSQSIEKSLPARADASVLVRNIAGAVKLSGWSKNEVHVSGVLSDGTSLDFHQVGDGVEVRVIYPQNSHNHAQADLTISVPVASRLSVNTVSAGIQAMDLTGPQQLESVSGDVQLESRSADISAKSVSGEVTINGSAKDAHVLAHSVSGDVKISHVAGDLQAESVSGTIKVSDQSRLTRARLGSTSGNVEVVAAIAKGGSYSLNSVSGNITLSFPGKPDARFDISSFSGDIDNSFGPKAQRTSQYAPGKELHFTSGKGSAQVNIRTMSGNIDLETH